MSAIAILASAVLGFWLLTSIGMLFEIGWLQRLVTPLQRFRFFGPWAMFAAGQGRKGSYNLAYRDLKYPGDNPAWRIAATGHHWSWHVFLLDPRRSIADAVHFTGRSVHRHLQQGPTPSAAREIAFAQIRLRDYLDRLAPQPAHTKREVRVIKQLGVGASMESEVVYQFVVATDDER
jgi:hypothetical protein